MPPNYERVKLPNTGKMDGVAFHTADVLNLGAGPHVLLQGGARKGITPEMWLLQTDNEGFSALHAHGDMPSERTQATLNVLDHGEKTSVLFGGFALNGGELNETWWCQLEEDMDDMSLLPKWKQLAPAGEPPPKRYGHTANMLSGQRLIVVGGQNATTQFNDVHMLDLSELPGTWSCLAENTGPPLLPRTRHTCTQMADDRLIIVGGFHRHERALDDVWSLKVSDDGTTTWDEVAPDTGDGTFEARTQHSATAIGGNHVLVFGGYDGNKNLQDTWMLDVQEAKMVEIKCGTKPEPRCRHSAHYLNNAFTVIGGYDGFKPHSGDVVIYTLEIDDAAKLMKAAAAEQ
jgi:hypothetical protein